METPMHDLSNVRKAIAAALTGIATWGATAQVDGIDTAEWWGLFGVLVGAFLVWLTKNEPAAPFFGRTRNEQTLLDERLLPYDDEHTTGSDAS